MITFKTYINEDLMFEQYYLNLLMEEKKESSSGQAADTKGKLHEILTGFHLNNGNHMEKHPDKEGDSPQEAHDKLKDLVNPDEYEKINKRAKSTASDIQAQVEKNGSKISDVHWTSKPGDIEKSTGVPSTQKQDASDIMIHAKDKTGRVVHTGVSLKVTDGTTHHVPVSNAGTESMHPSINDDLRAHRELMYKAFPDMKNLTNKEQRKTFRNSDPEIKDKMDQMNLAFRRGVASKTHEHLLSMGRHELIDHIKKHVLQANPTPLQTQGHNHIRHTVYVAGKKEGGGNKFHSYDPSQHWSHILDGSKKIHVTNPSGTTQLNFHYEDGDGVKHHFATQALKANSNSDPMSPMKSTGKAAGKE
jgi:hypothetical protein